MGRTFFVVAVLAALALIGCVHVPSEVEATFAPAGAGESNNFHKGTHPVPGPAPSVAAPGAAPTAVPVPESPDAQKAKGGDA